MARFWRRLRSALWFFLNRNFEHFTINGCRNPTPLLCRFKLWKTRRGNLYLHWFYRSDEDRELHDHPWSFITVPLWNGYVEEVPVGAWIGRPFPVETVKKRRWPLIPLYRPANWAHRVDMVTDKDGNEKDCITLIWVFPKSRQWGFFCKDGWTPQPEYHKSKGCAGDE